MRQKRQAGTSANAWLKGGGTMDNFKPECHQSRRQACSEQACFLGMDTLSLTKEARIYNGLKTISLTSGAGKSDQPLVKE